MQKNRELAIVDWEDDDVYRVDGLGASALRSDAFLSPDGNN